MTIQETKYSSSSSDTTLPEFILWHSGRKAHPDLLPNRTERPTIKDPKNTEELRAGAIFYSYCNLIDITCSGGFDVLYGNAERPRKKPLSRTEPCPGTEYLAVAIDPRPADEQGPASNRQHVVTLAVQIPDTFDPENPRILAAPSPGSRGVYGAVNVGEWGLRNGFAVAYTDKGTGAGIHDLKADSVILADGTVAPSTDANAIEQAAFTVLNYKHTTDRVAYKQAHSQAHPEQAWGQYTVLAIEYALYVLSQEYPARSQSFTSENTLILGASISNGGAAVLRAAERSGKRLFHGIVVAEPNINPIFDGTTLIQQGNQRPLAEHSRSLLDYTTLINVYQGCIDDTKPAANRSACLASKKVLRSQTLAQQRAEAQAEINRYGILPEQNAIQKIYWRHSAPQAISVTYSSAYGRLRADDTLLGYSFGATNGQNQPVAVEPTIFSQAFALSSGLVPDSLLVIKLINDRVDPAQEDKVSSPDANLDGALRLRSLFLGRDAVTGAPLPDDQQRAHQTIMQSIESVRASGALHGIPTIIIHGRADCVIAPNHSSRPYYALALKHGGEEAGNVRYYEVTNATHIDGLLADGLIEPEKLGDDYVPLHRYVIQGLDLMWRYLETDGKSSLPPSQVVHTVPRKGRDITRDNADLIVPPIKDVPCKKDLITFEHGILHVPD